jgi:hypothetical protein
MEIEEKRHAWLQEKNSYETRHFLEEALNQIEEKMENIENEKLLKACLVKKRELDHALDEVEEVSLESVNQAKLSLIATIIEKYPEERLRINNLQEEISTREELAVEYQKMEDILQEASASIESVLTTRQTVKRKGIFSFLFGKNPNVIITSHIYRIRELIKQDLPKIEILAGKTKGEQYELYGEVIVLFSHLKTECSKRWNYKRIDTTFIKARESIRELEMSFTKLKDESKRELKEKETELEDWLRHRK